MVGGILLCGFEAPMYQMGWSPDDKACWALCEWLGAKIAAWKKQAEPVLGKARALTVANRLP
jgi:hypothetical protein